MSKFRIVLLALGATALSSCATGPRPSLAMPEVRSTPVLAAMSTSQLLDQGKSYLRMKQYGLAIEMLRGAARDPAQTAEAYNGLAIAYDGIGRRDLAESYFQRAIAEAPGEARYETNLGRFYAASNQPEKQRRLLADLEAARKQADAERMAAAPVRMADDAAEPAPLAAAASADAALATTADSPVVAVPASMSYSVRLAPESPIAAALAPAIADATTADFAAIEFGGARCTIGNATDAAGPCLWQANDGLTANALAGKDRMMVRTSLGEVFLITGEPDPAFGIARIDVAAPKPAIKGRSMLGMVAAMLAVQNRAAAATRTHVVPAGKPLTIRVTRVGKGPPS
jgi:tetratricopeptide (TPR) repeat protein